MIVFRPREQEEDPADLLGRLAVRVGDAAPATHEAIVEWLIDAGMLEAALADAMHPDDDGDDGITLAASAVTEAAGTALAASWAGESVRAPRARLEQAVRALSRRRLPARVSVRIPEGFVFYGLYPETYLAATDRFARECRPANVVCLGLRSIGTSLSAVVTAALRRNRCVVLRRSLRPHGHPWDRRLAFDADLRELLHARRNAWFLVADEGPGLSGSSMAGTAEALSELGVRDERIVFLPSWKPDPASLVSERARARWRRHAVYAGNFEEAWVGSGRLAASLGVGELEDVSAGRWRPHLYRDGSPQPAVQPQHERRKFLATRRGTRVLAKFVGLGTFGRSKLDRARRLAEAGFVPEVLGFANGFLLTRFVEGTPARRAPLPRDLEETMARYLAFLRREFPVDRGTPLPQIVEMARTNVAEGLGKEWADRLRRAGALERAAVEPVALDGRMLPHEWLRTSEGWLKTDATDHHDDHFFPGCCDIAWDVSAACEEFALGVTACRDLVLRVAGYSGDRGLARRIAPFRVAYLAYRLGYAELASRSVGPPDGVEWKSRAEDYRKRLRAAIEGIER